MTLGRTESLSVDTTSLRHHPPARSIITPPFTFSTRDMKHGRIPVHARVLGDAPSGRRQRIVASLALEPATYLTDSRDMRVLPPPEPYLGNDPPTKFDFARTTAMTIEAEGAATAEIRTDAANDILLRAISPEMVEATCDVPGVQVAVRWPRDGIARAEAHASPEVTPESEGVITVTLSIEGGTTFTASRPCRVIEVRRRTRRSGDHRAPVPDYHILRVWRATSLRHHGPLLPAC